MKQLLSRVLALCALLAVVPLAGQAQISGNQVTGSRGGRYRSGEGSSPAALLPDKLLLTDSTFLVSANVMQHVRADHYVAVFSLRQEARTVAGAEKRLSARIQRFTGQLRKLDVDAAGIYTDIITQTQVHDVRTTTQAGRLTNEEYLRGFELTRNVIVPFRRAEALNQMLVAAAADSIYDLVKVDYIVSNPEAVYANLFKAATEVIGRKKANYLALTAAQVYPMAQPYTELFSAFTPGNQYSAYEAAVKTPLYQETDEEGRRRERYKALPTLTTYYYNAPAADGFDRVINPIVTEPVVTYTLALQVKYTLQKPTRR